MSKQAFVNEIIAKETSFGVMYDFALSNGERVGAGKFKPKGIESGDYIAYDTVAKGKYLNFAPGSVSKIDKPAGVEAPSKSPTFVPSADKRQETISKQAALNSALTFVGLLSAAEALPMPKSTKASDKADILLDIVNHYTGHFYTQATGQEMEFGPVSSGSPADLSAAESGDSWNEE